MKKGTSGSSWFFAILLTAMTAYFIYWGLNYTNGSNVVIFLTATFFGIFMAFNIGGNDVANSFGTSVGSRTLTIKQALVIAAVFEVSGALIAGGAVTKTIRKGIVDLSVVQIDPIQFVYVMMSALLAAGLWLLFASRKGYPVSTTHSVVGGIVGSSITLGYMNLGYEHAFSLVKWSAISKIAISWVISPILGGIISYSLFYIIKKYVLNYNDDMRGQLTEIKYKKKVFREEHKAIFEAMTDKEKTEYTYLMTRDSQIKVDRDFGHKDFESDYYRTLHEIEQKKHSLHVRKALENYVPLIAFVSAVVMAGMLMLKGLKSARLGLSISDKFIVILIIAILAWAISFIFARILKSKPLHTSTYLMFSWMQVFTASGFAFSHGANDIANAIGPFAAILDVLHTGKVGIQTAVPPIAMITFGIALISGLWFIGKEVIATVGTHLARMHPASGFSAELSAAAVVLVASISGIPVSSTHILIGAVLGIGVVNNNTNWKLMKPIALAWVTTLPAAAILSSITYLVLSKVF